MSDFTYEFNTPKSSLETYEWDNLWWEKANDTENKDRVLIIGDSISCSYRKMVNEILDGRIYADGLGTSKALDNPAFLALFDFFMAQCPDCKAIQFNNGLHGWHMSNESYFEHYAETIRYIKNKYPDKKLIIALTTPARRKDNIELFGERNEIVLARNMLATEIAKREGIVVNDFYSIVCDNPEYFFPDGIHIMPEACMLLARQCADTFCKVLDVKL